MTQWSRRLWLQRAGLAAVAGFVPKEAWSQHKMAMHDGEAAHNPRTLDAAKLEPFVDRLPLPEVQMARGTRSDAERGAEHAEFYRVRMRAITAKMHRDLPACSMWSYGASSAPVLFEARCGKGVLIEWSNELPAKHILPLDQPMAGMAVALETRAIAHMHGARVRRESDGYPEDWFGPGKSKLCFYPNQQDATALWVHDHAMGVSRFNVIAGLMGFYMLRSEEEDALGLPSGKYELPLMIYDRSFTPDGQLYYPNPPDEGAWAQEYLGDAMVVNGKVQPFCEVEPRRYRLRVVNTANSRFFSLSLSNGQSYQVIGSDQGLLAAPVDMTRMVLAPAERTDIIVDFAHAPGQHVVLESDGLELMQFRVSASPVEDTSRVPPVLRRIERTPESQAVRKREMTLNQFDDPNGEAMVMLLNRKHWAEPVTEIVKLDSTEIWSLVNLTEDTHPIHLHLVRFQILDRQAFSPDDYLGGNGLQYTGEVMSPSPHEMGWKDIVQCPAYTVTRIIVRFAGYAGRYLWHCHVLEHEANDMMRPFEVVA